MKNLKYKGKIILILLLQSVVFYSQSLPIIGFGDQTNYRIDYFTVPGSSGLDLHWHGGIRFGDNTGNSVMQITNGKVGIGTTTPQAKLSIVPSANHVPGGQPTLRICEATDNENYGLGLSTYYNGSNYVGKLQQFHGGTPSDILLNPEGGNVGIGTISPNAKLDVNVGSLNDRFQIRQGGSVRFYASGDGVVGWGGSADFGFLSWDNDFAIIGGQSGKALSLRANGTDQVRITTAGNVGIGTTNPNNKLDVNGTVHSKEVKVDMIGWSDFVFKKEYTLPTLEEVEKQINEKGHLANIPSEQEVLKNGINLGEMNAKLLQKIEELTLYMIEMKKENEEIKKENLKMKKNQIDLEKRLLKIENK